jgi:hypothetical protein
MATIHTCFPFSSVPINVVVVVGADNSTQQGKQHSQQLITGILLLIISVIGSKNPQKIKRIFVYFLPPPKPPTSPTANKPQATHKARHGCDSLTALNP